MKITDKYIFFWNSPFSQWLKSPIEHNGITFNTAEQYMMYHKALAFDDQIIADQILASNNPKEQKALGRKVKNFSNAVWDVQKYQVVLTCNLLKFWQNKGLLKEILNSKYDNKTFVEASPYDKVWGIGMHEDDYGVEDAANWKGENLLGKVITETRKMLIHKKDEE